MHVCDPFSPNATTGNWAVINPIKPVCIAGTCPDPPVIPGAYYVNTTLADEFKKFDVVKYYCKSGFKMSGAVIAEATCTFTPPTGWTWADGKPQCNCIYLTT